MPEAFKGYPYRMKQAIKATTLILFVSLLSGCSSAEAKACEAAQIAYKDYYKQAEDFATLLKSELRDKVAEQNNELVNKYAQSSGENLTKSNLVIINNAKCFAPQQVVEAQMLVDDK
jgi:hypothetical protein